MDMFSIICQPHIDGGHFEIDGDVLTQIDVGIFICGYELIEFDVMITDPFSVLNCYNQCTT